MVRLPRSFAALLCAVLFCLGLFGTAGARADVLASSYNALPVEKRIAVQRELKRADLYLAETDGRWTSATERALRRSVETIALMSQDRLHPDLRNSVETVRYLVDLGEGTYSPVLYGGSLIQRIFSLAGDPVMKVQEELADKARGRR